MLILLISVIYFLYYICHSVCSSIVFLAFSLFMCWFWFFFNFSWVLPVQFSFLSDVIPSYLWILVLLPLGFPCGPSGKPACNTGDLGLISGLGRFPGEGKGYPLQYSGLENSMNCIVHGVAKSQTRLSNCHFLSYT